MKRPEKSGLFFARHPTIPYFAPCFLGPDYPLRLAQCFSRGTPTDVIMPWIIRDDDEDNAFNEMMGNPSDRAAALIAASFVGSVLEQKLADLFLDDAEIRDQMLRADGPLGSFAARMKACCLMRLYGKRAYRELNTIRRIRNEFAHRTGYVDFATPAIRDLCRNLTLIDGYHITFDQQRADGARYSGVTSYILTRES
jgi:hypothetical protein